MVMEQWILDNLRMERVFGVRKWFLTLDNYTNINFISVKVTDDILYAGSIEPVKQLAYLFRQTFEIIK